MTSKFGNHPPVQLIPAGTFPDIPSTGPSGGPRDLKPLRERRNINGLVQQQLDAYLCTLISALNVLRNQFETAVVTQLVRDALSAEEREMLFWLLAQEKSGRAQGPAPTNSRLGTVDGICGGTM